MDTEKELVKLNQNKMKYSKELPEWLRKRCWGKFMSISIRSRKAVYRNSFESYCSEFINVP